jgi:hypothetical protein
MPVVTPRLRNPDRAPAMYFVLKRWDKVLRRH